MSTASITTTPAASVAAATLPQTSSSAAVQAAAQTIVTVAMNIPLPCSRPASAPSQQLTTAQLVALCAPSAAPEEPVRSTYTPPPAPVVRAPVTSRISDAEGIAIHNELMNIFNNPAQYTQRVSGSYSVPVPTGDTEGEICRDDDIHEINTEITNRWNRIHYALENGRQTLAILGFGSSSFNTAYIYGRNVAGDTLHPDYTQQFLRCKGLEAQAAELKRTVENINRRLNP